jgi:hypothetical protein
MHHVSLYTDIKDMIKSLADTNAECLILGCGHCKNLKPELIQASIDLHEQQV